MYREKLFHSVINSVVELCPQKYGNKCGKNDLFHLESSGGLHNGVTYELDIEDSVIALQK